MTLNTFYRLAEFKIIENENGNLWWETHSGLGSLKTGTCFIRGNILFIESSASEESGFLKGEFLDRLYQFPMWEKTEFFCTNYTIYNCNSGRKTTSAELMTPALNRTNGEEPKAQGVWDRKLEDAAFQDADNSLSYKLGRYEIIEKDNGGIWWRKTTGFQGIMEGKCFISGDILFIGKPEKARTGYSKRSFMAQLQQRAKWKKTTYYSDNYGLFECRAFDGFGQKRDKKAFFNRFLNIVQRSGTRESTKRDISSNKQDVPKNIINQGSHGPKRRAFFLGVFFIAVILVLLFAVLIGHQHERKEEGRNERQKHYSRHHN